MMWTVGKEGKPKHIVMLLPSKRGSKWYRLTCFCQRRRKDGTCQLTDGIRPLLVGSKRHLIHLDHPQIDETIHRLPDPDPRAWQLTPEIAEKVAAA